MCPSFKATGDRRRSPKGRASLFREWLRRLSDAGVDPVAEARRARASSPWRGALARLRNSRAAEPDFSHEVKDAMDGCLACKSCSGQCPIKVDVPTFRAKFLELYHTRYARPLKDHLIAQLETVLPLGARFHRIANAVMGSTAGRALGRKAGLVDAPLFSGIDLRAEAARRGVHVAAPARLRAIPAADRDRHVVIVQDAFTSFFETELVLDLLDLLLALGFTPWLAPFRPNGKPLHVHGFLGRFGKQAAENAALLRALADTGVELLGLDPSMTLTYRAEYAGALGADAPRVLLPQEWLASRLALLPPLPPGAPLMLLPHCTERTNAVASLKDWQAIFSHLGAPLRVLATGCCGMAGTFGHEAEHRDMSERLYDLGWRQKVAAHGDALVATGYSCRSQVKRFDGVRIDHPVQALLRRLQKAPAEAVLEHAA
jgi:Fe-S oxidoreductase